MSNQSDVYYKRIEALQRAFNAHAEVMRRQLSMLKQAVEKEILKKPRFRSGETKRHPITMFGINDFPASGPTYGNRIVVYGEDGAVIRQKIIDLLNSCNDLEDV